MKKFTLEELGYNIIDITDNGQDAINIAAETSPDLTIMDINLKGEMNGIEAAKKLSELNLPVIFLTAYTDDDTFNKIINDLSVYGFISKPFNKKTIGMSIDFAIKRAKIDAEKLNIAHGFVKK